jgi:phosphoglucosamine mutase
MSKIKFGTDGVRGTANISPMDPQTVFYIGLAAGQVLGKGGKAIIATDGRRSGSMLQAAFSAGMASTGVTSRTGGIMPTAALSLAVQATKADLGIMITASHNPAIDNGVKLFAVDGSKISDAQQSQIENLINNPKQIIQCEPHGIGQIITDDSIVDAYTQLLQELIKDEPLAGLKLVIDCANGAASKIAPELLVEAGADITAIFDKPNGDNINQDCGSTHPQNLSKAVIASNADAGIAFDGDADRVLLVDEAGKLIDGDQILARLATDWKQQGILQGDRVIATVMSNMGLQNYLQGIGVSLVRTAVGDRHVAAKMQELKANLGGEQSGHILLPAIIPSGDGLISGLLPLISLAKSGVPASQHLQCFTANPQILHNLRHNSGDPLSTPAVTAVISDVENTLGTSGRVLVRASGTEAIIRIMVEAKTVNAAQAAIDKIVKAITELKCD